MDSIDLTALERRTRQRYEWARTRDALLGVAPVAMLAVIAASLGDRGWTTVFCAAVAAGGGAVALWYGRGFQRAFAAGVASGLIPLVCALGASRLGHVCTGDRCMALCVPACAIGGVIAGFVVGRASAQRSNRLSFWCVASSFALLTGTMGCACVGFSGVVGLTLGFGVGLLPDGVRTVRAARAR